MIHSTAQHSTVQNSTVQYSTVQYSKVQYSKVQYSAVQEVKKAVEKGHMGHLWQVNDRSWTLSTWQRLFPLCGQRCDVHKQ